MDEALDCWDDFPYEHGCICGNDCKPPCEHDWIPQWSGVKCSRCGALDGF